MNHIFGNQITETDWYHIGVIRGPMTRNIWNRFPDILDEVRVAMKEKLPLSEGTWYSRHTYRRKLPTYSCSQNGQVYRQWTRSSPL